DGESWWGGCLGGAGAGRGDAAYRVDHKIRYMPELARTLTPRYTQKSTSMTWRSQGPVCGMPYWQMLVEMMPILSPSAPFRYCVSRGPSYETTWACQHRPFSQTSSLSMCSKVRRKGPGTHKGIDK